MIRAFLDNLRLATGTFRAWPLRSLLTLLGIVIGVATVVTMMALLEGLKIRVNRDLSQLGANVFSVSKWPQGIRFGGRGLDWSRIEKRKNLNLEDRRAVLEHSPSVVRAAAMARFPAQTVSTSTAEAPSVFVIGATYEYLETSGATIESGRNYSEADELDARRVLVLGPDVVDILFPRADPIGQEVRLRGRTWTVVGVMARRGSMLGMFSLDNQVMMPISAFLDTFGKARGVSLSIEAVDQDALEKAQEEVTRVLRQRRQVPPTEENDFEINTNESMASTLNNLAQVVTAATFGVCVLSLLVGGIGILNIMLVAVTERTREIGVRKALGARRRRILAQFTTEAVALSLVGGILGLLLGFGVAFLGRWLFGLDATVPGWAIALSLGMSSGVGLIFGIYPAARAARLMPVDAMRQE
jgi:putative ABC transport system permease protein